MMISSQNYLAKEEEDPDQYRVGDKHNIIQFTLEVQD